MAGPRDQAMAQPSTPKGQHGKSEIPCRFFAQGSCRDGAKCVFSHDDASKGKTKAAPAPTTTTLPSRPARPLVKPKAPCPFYANGTCRQGEKCAFEHQDTPQVAPSHQSTTADPQSPKNVDTQAKVVCQFYKQGTCRRAEKCSFLHEDALGDPAPAKRQNQTPTDPRAAIPCHFYARGRCREGERCPFSHQEASTVPSSNIRHTLSATRDPRAQVPCKFFATGICREGKSCSFLHQEASPQDGTGASPVAGPQVQSERTDPRAQVVCKFFSMGVCRDGERCPYSHPQEKVIEAIPQPDVRQSSTRAIGGALAKFGGGAKILKVSVPSDFSTARLGNLPPGSSPSSVTETLAKAGFTVRNACVQVTGRTATVRAEDPSFAERLCARLGADGGIPGTEKLSAVRANTTLPQSDGSTSRRIDCNKVYCSWHKPARTAWLNFWDEDLAEEVKDGYSSGEYEILEQRVKCTGPTSSQSEYNVMWTVRLAELPFDITEEDILEEIPSEMEPVHIEISEPTYTKSPEAVSELVKEMLLAVGPLDAWEVGSTGEGKRIKAKARFQDEEDARRAAASLDKSLLSFNRGNRLTVQLVHAARLKVSDRIYNAVQPEIEEESHTWKAKDVLFTAYPASRGYRVLRLEGQRSKSVANANTKLESILAGEIAVCEEKSIWAGSFGGGGFQEKFKAIETRLGVVIVRNKRRSRLHICGTPDKRAEAARLLEKLAIREVSAVSSIELTMEQFTWACHGGFRTISSALGADVVSFDLTSNPRRILVGGPSDNYKRAMRMIADEKEEGQVGTTADTREDCTICFTEAEDPIFTRCKHTYCGDCFEAFCFANSTGPSELCIRCEGAGGTCKAELALDELQELLSSGTFEDLLEASFASHVRRHPADLRHCRTPDCDQIYRATSAAGTFTCTRCLELTCTRCHEGHHGISCEGHARATTEDQAFEEAKKELGIKDCPRCKTAIEKTGGCSHMTCRGCGEHICWVCLETFEEGWLCQDHMSEVHDGFYEE